MIPTKNSFSFDLVEASAIIRRKVGRRILARGGSIAAKQVFSVPGRSSGLRKPKAVISRGPSVVADAPDSRRQTRNSLNDLTAKEWIPETVSVWLQRGLGAGHPDTQIEREHPAPFSYTDVGRLVRFFTKRGETVLDPFVGIGSTLKACAVHGRQGIGIELNPRYAELASQRLHREQLPADSAIDAQTVLQGDSAQVLRTMATNTIDFVVTSPPYWRILHKVDHKARQLRTTQSLDTRYSDDSRDLGNILLYSDFLAAVASILSECARVLRDRRYLAAVVGDFRDKGSYHMFHADLAKSLEESFCLKGITILYQNHKRVYPYGYPTAFVPNLHHQYIMIFQVRK